MDENKVLVKNLATLCSVYGCGENASKFARLINEKAGKEVIDRSYLARILKNSPSDPANISWSKLCGVARALGIEAWQLGHPSGFDERGISRAASGSVDRGVLLRAMKYAKSGAEELHMDNINFECEVAADSYASIIDGEEEKLGFHLARLAKQYSM